jgi:hypothetical protein
MILEDRKFYRDIHTRKACKISTWGDTSHCIPALVLLSRTYYHLMPTVKHLLLECPVRAPHPQMVRSDCVIYQPMGLFYTL